MRHPLPSYSKDYDPEDWLQVDRATGQVQTQRVLSPASPFLKDGWYRAIILALDDGEAQHPPPGASPGAAGPEPTGLPLCSVPAAHGHRHAVRGDPGGE